MWIYIPNITTFAASLSAQDMQASILACISQSQNIALWLSSSGKLMRQPLSWRGWKTRPWLTRLYGTISNPSMADRGAAAFISSVPAIHASHSASLAHGEEQRILDTCGRMSRASSTRSSPSGSSAKMSKDISAWDLPTSRQNYGQWATRQRQACSLREKRGQAISGAGSSCWPTPTASDGGYFPDLVISDQHLKMTGPFDCSMGSGGQFGLSTAARSWTSLWLVMKAMGWNPAEQSTGYSRPARVSFRSGTGSLIGDLISNPRFSDQMIGWPIGWSDPGRPVTGFAAWLRRSRGELYQLLTADRQR